MNSYFDELTSDELTFCCVGFDQFSLLNFSCLVDMEPGKGNGWVNQGGQRQGLGKLEFSEVEAFA